MRDKISFMFITCGADYIPKTETSASANEARWLQREIKAKLPSIATDYMLIERCTMSNIWEDLVITLDKLNEVSSYASIDHVPLDPDCHLAGFSDKDYECIWELIDEVKIVTSSCNFRYIETNKHKLEELASIVNCIYVK